MSGVKNFNDDKEAVVKPLVSIDPVKSRVVREFQQGRAPGYCCFDRSGRFLFVGSEDNRIQQWNFETGENAILEGHESWVRGFAFPETDKVLVSSGYDGALIWWNLEASAPRVTFRVQAHHRWIRDIALSPDGQFLASGGNDQMVRVWSMADRTLVKEMSGHHHDICSLAFHPDGQHLVSADAKCIVKVWEPLTGQAIRELDASSTYFQSKSNRGVSGGLRSLVFSADGSELIGSGVVGGGDPLGQAVNPGAIVFDWKSGERQSLLRARGNELGVAWKAVYHPAGSFVIAVSGGMSAKHVYFWRMNEEQPFHVVELPSPGRSIALHPDGKHLAVALHDGKIQIYSMS